MTRATGIRRHGAGWEASVFVAGIGRHTYQFGIAEPLEVMQAWQRTERARMQLTLGRRGDRPQAGTLARDAQTYLRTVRAMPSYVMRARDIELWIARFGTRRRDTIAPSEIRAQRDAWLLHGPKRIYRKPVRVKGTRSAIATFGYWEDVDAPLAPSTVNHRLRALSHLYTTLDPQGYNPVRDVPECDEGDGEPRGIPWAVAQAILEAMPDRGQPTRGRARPEASQTKARLRVMYWTGLSQKQLMQLRRKDVSLEAATVYVERRKKGAGAPGHTKPLLPDAVAAFETFFALGCEGPFSTSAMRQAFRRACARLGLTGLRPYDFRHGFAADVYQATGNIKATRDVMGHADHRTTERYARAAVAPVVAEAMAKVQALRQASAAIHERQNKS